MWEKCAQETHGGDGLEVSLKLLGCHGINHPILTPPWHMHKGCHGINHPILNPPDRTGAMDWKSHRNFYTHSEEVNVKGVALRAESETTIW